MKTLASAKVDLAHRNRRNIREGAAAETLKGYLSILRAWHVELDADCVNVLTGKVSA